MNPVPEYKVKRSAPACTNTCLVRALAVLDILIDTIEPPQFLGEERPGLREPLPRIDTSV
jgi:hypothetical protein